MAGRLLPELFGDRGNKLPLTYEARLAQLARRRRESAAFAGDPSKASTGRMVSGHYIRPWENISQAAGAIAHQLQQNKFDQQEAELVKEREAEFNRVLGEVPTPKMIPEMGPPSPDGAMVPGGVQEPSATDFMQWGGKMAQLGPFGQQIGAAAIGRGIDSMLPKINAPDYEKVEMPLPDGRKQLAYIDKRNPSAPPKLVGQPFTPTPTRTPELQQRLQLSQRAMALQNTPNRTPAQDEELASLKLALNAMNTVAGPDGSVTTVDKPSVLAAGGQGFPGAAPPLQQQTPLGSPAAPQPPAPQPGPVSAGSAIPPDVKALLEANPTATVYGGGKESAASLKIEELDEWAPYRRDPRNAPYIPKTAGPGTTTITAGTGAQQRLNADIQKLSKEATDEKIPVLEDAWAEFEKVAKKVREGNTRAKANAPKTMTEKALNLFQFGGGYGGTLGINNVLPNALTADEARDLRIATEKLKAFERNRLFGQTLTGNEKQSFEQMAGTLFGMNDQDFEFAMQKMRDGFEAGKQSVYAGYAPIVVDKWNKQRGRNNGDGAPKERAPYFSGKF